MNRTLVFLSTAALLALVALVLAVPQRPAPVSPAAPATPPSPPAPAPHSRAAAPVSPGSLKLEARLSHPTVPTGTSDVFATVQLSAVNVPGGRRAPVNLALVIDRSGSMRGQKLAHALAAAQALVERLGEEDTLSVVHYGTHVEALPGVRATPEGKQRLTRFIRRIAAIGGTDIGRGLEAGKAHLQRAAAGYRVSRLLLLSDGEPTMGTTDPRALAALAQRVRAAGISVTAVGVGAEFNEDLMQRIAEVGGGSYGYLRHSAQLATVFDRDLAHAGATVARGVSVSVEVPENVGLLDIIGYRHERSGRTVRVWLPDFASGQQEKLVLHLRVSSAAPDRAMDLVRVGLNYDDLLAGGVPRGERALLSARSSGRREEVLAQVDRQALVLATKARTAVNYRKAAEALGRGDAPAASGYLQQNRALLDGVVPIAGNAAVAKERRQNEVDFGLVQADSGPAAGPDANERSHRVKSFKLRSLRESGRSDAAAYGD